MSIKVLIIDDNAEDISSLKKSLSQAGFECEFVEVKTGSKGLDIVREESPDVVFVEVKLPDINGFDMCKRIKQINNVIKVLIVTRYQDAIDHEKAENAGAEQHTVKTKSNKFLINSFREIFK